MATRRHEPKLEFSWRQWKPILCSPSLPQCPIISSNTASQLVIFRLYWHRIIELLKNLLFILVFYHRNYIRLGLSFKVTWFIHLVLDNTLCMLSCFSCAQLFVTLWTIAHRLLCWWDSPGKNIDCSGLPCPPPGDLPNPEIKPRSPTLQVYSLPSEPPGKPQITPYKPSIVFYMLRLPIPVPSHLVNSYSTFTFWTNTPLSGKVYMRSLNSFCSIYHSFITAILFPSVQWWWAPVFFVSQLNLYTTVPDTEKMLVNID